jgi:hypothetical protein
MPPLLGGGGGRFWRSLTAGAAFLAGGAGGAPVGFSSAFAFPAGGERNASTGAGVAASSSGLTGMAEAKAAQKARIKEAVWTLNCILVCCVKTGFTLNL